MQNLNRKEKSGKGNYNRKDRRSLIHMKQGGELISKHIPLFPPKKKAFLPYYEYFQLSSSGFLSSSYVMSANGLFDPNITGVGHQPAGFDQMMQYYEHYTVLRAKIVVDFRMSAGSGGVVAISTKADVTPVTGVVQGIEGGLIDYRVISGNVASPHNFVRISRTVDIANFGGVDDLLDNENYRGSLSSNPTEGTYFHMTVWNEVGTSTTVDIGVLIEYEAMFTEPKPPPMSLKFQTDSKVGQPDPTPSVKGEQSSFHSDLGGEYLGGEEYATVPQSSLIRIGIPGVTGKGPHPGIIDGSSRLNPTSRTR